MQPLTAPPRDGLTADLVTWLLRDAAKVDYTRGLEVLNLDLSVLADLSEVFLAGSVSRNMGQTIHGTCALTIGTDIAYGAQFLKPNMTLSATHPEFGRLSARFNGGVYQGTKPTSSYGDSVPSNQFTGSDRLAQINRPVGDAYSVNPAHSTAEAILAVFAAAGIPAAHVLIDGSGAQEPAFAFTWPLLTDPNLSNYVPVDAVADDNNAVTYLRIINALCWAADYRGVWCDWDGYFRIQPHTVDATRAVEFTFDVDDPLRAIVARGRSRTRDISSTPNEWVFVQSNLVDGSGNPILPEEGAGQFTLRNDLDGDTCIAARGGDPVGVYTSVVQVDAVDQATLVSVGKRLAAADQAVATTFALPTSPFPAAWHEDTYAYSDLQMGVGSGGSMKLQSTGWTLDYGNSTAPPADMTHQLKQVA